jgi:hypothetical protein
LLKFDSVPAVVSSGERITRFVFFNRHIKNGNTSFAAFLPNAKGETSVFRTNRCTEKKVWLLGELFVARARKDGRPVIARADVNSETILDENLKIVSTPDSHPRHADICNWPDERARQRIKAMALAQKATLRLNQ